MLVSEPAFAAASDGEAFSSVAGELPIPNALRAGTPRGEPGARRGTSMAQGGATRLAQHAAIAVMAILLGATGAAAEDASTAPVSAEISPALRSAAAAALPPRAGALAADSLFGAALPPLRGAFYSLRPGPGPARGEDVLSAAATRHGGAPLYGVLAGQALLSALHLHGDLPAHMTPWFDADRDRMLAGFELSF